MRFIQRDSAMKAILKLNGQVYRGRTMDVQVSCETKCRDVLQKDLANGAANTTGRCG